MLQEVFKWFSNTAHDFSEVIGLFGEWFTNTTFLEKIIFFALILAVIWLLKQFLSLPEKEEINEERYIHNRQF